MPPELVSVVLPAYNRRKTIRRAVCSVLEQTYPHLEIVVIDDASTDGTLDELAVIRDSRLRYVRLDKNSGACVARNHGVELAKGSLVAFQDSDDVWYPDKLEKQVAHLAAHSLEFATCGLTRISSWGRELIGMVDCPNDPIRLWCQLFDHNWISTQTILCRRYCFEKIAFDPAVKRFQDWDLGLQAARFFRIGSLNECLVDVYLQGDSITNTIQSDEAKLFIAEKHRDDLIPGNRAMAAQYYKTFADVTRRRFPFRASGAYFRSFVLAPTPKKLACGLLSAMGLMRFYRSRR